MDEQRHLHFHTNGNPASSVVTIPVIWAHIYLPFSCIKKSCLHRTYSPVDFNKMESRRTSLQIRLEGHVDTLSWSASPNVEVGIKSVIFLSDNLPGFLIVNSEINPFLVFEVYLSIKFICCSSCSSWWQRVE